MRDLVFVKFNSKLRHKRENKSRDPIKKDIDDVLCDDGNEFITRAVVVPIANDEQQEDGASQRESTSQPQAKRKRPVRHRKKKIKSLQSLMRDALEQPAASTSSSEYEDGDGNGDISMHSSDPDNSPSVSGSGDD